ncbi:unnamed protein product [Rhizophagus irregularis]|nr:unnamed protein product [Rhizophagus irregularis]
MCSNKIYWYWKVWNWKNWKIPIASNLPMHITGYNPFGDDELRLKPIGFNFSRISRFHIGYSIFCNSPSIRGLFNFFHLILISSPIPFSLRSCIDKKESLALFNYKRGCYKKSAALVSPLFVYLFLCYNDE